jgi:hypothetical protein
VRCKWPARKVWFSSSQFESGTFSVNDHGNAEPTKPASLNQELNIYTTSHTSFPSLPLQQSSNHILDPYIHSSSISLTLDTYNVLYLQNPRRPQTLRTPRLPSRHRYSFPSRKSDLKYICTPLPTHTSYHCCSTSHRRHSRQNRTRIRQTRSSSDLGFRAK